MITKEIITRQLLEHPTRFDVGQAIDKRIQSLQGKPHELALFMKEFVGFNSCFAAGALNLAHTWAQSKRGANQSEENYFTHNSKVASLILRSVLDELGLGQESRITHKEMAWRMLQAMKKFKVYEAEIMLPVLKPGIKGQINGGYSGDTFFSLGFHYASERNAASEFSSVLNSLCVYFPELSAHLNTATFPDQNQEGNFDRKAISWLSDHTYLEEEHFAFTQQAVAVALETLTGHAELAHAHRDLLAGAKRYLMLQEHFYKADL